MEYIQMTLDDWLNIKDQLKKDLTGVTESFVRIGFRLRQIAEGRMYERDGYKTIAEFAQAEYGLSGSTVSRFMKINERYSVDGFSEYLRPEFVGYGSSKLGEMLALPAEDMEMIRPETTREVIRELKDFNKEPKKEEDQDMIAFFRAFYEKNEEALAQIREMEFCNLQKFVEIVNPTGQKGFRAGVHFMTMYEDKVVIKQYGKSPENMTWEKVWDITQQIIEHLPEEEKDEEGKTAEMEEEAVSDGGRDIAEADGVDREEDETDGEQAEGVQDDGKELLDDDREGDGSDEDPEEDGGSGLLKKQDFAPAQNAEKPLKNKASEAKKEAENSGRNIRKSEQSQPKDDRHEQEDIQHEQEDAQPAADVITEMERKDYLDTLTAAGMAEYMAKWDDLPGTEGEWYEWLKHKVDERGEMV